MTALPPPTGRPEGERDLFFSNRFFVRGAMLVVPPPHAHVTSHTYRDGYGRPGMDRPFYMVRCDTCATVLNSGHHYTPENLPFAEQLAAEHNAAVHGEGTS